MALDAIGMFSPRLAHAQRFAGKLADLLAKPPEKFLDPGAPLPETPPLEVRQASSLARGTHSFDIANDPARGLGMIPVRDLPPELQGPTSAAGRMVNSVTQADPAVAAKTAAEATPSPAPPKVTAKKLAPLPEGFTPVDSTALSGYKYNPETSEFESITTGGQHYIHGDVSPEAVASFEAAKSKGKAWQELRNSPGAVLVAKVIGDKRMPVVKLRPPATDAPAAETAATPTTKPPLKPATKPPLKPATKPEASSIEDDLTKILQESLNAVLAKKATN
jgi:hypothetical protein